VFPAAAVNLLGAARRLFVLGQIVTAVLRPVLLWQEESRGERASPPTKSLAELSNSAWAAMGGDLHECIATRQVLETSIVLSASGHGGDAFPFYRILEGEAGHMPAAGWAIRLPPSPPVSKMADNESLIGWRY